MIQWWLLANTDLGRSFSRYSRRSGSLSENWFLVAVFVAIPVLWGALTYWDKYRKRHAPSGNNPKSLFLELCRAHTLSRADRSLLLKAAETRRLKQPAMVFIDPAILRELAAARSADAGAYRQLAKKVLGAECLAETVPHHDDALQTSAVAESV